MSSELTRESRKALKAAYDIYSERRKTGQSKSAAIRFDSPMWGGGQRIDGMSDLMPELSRAGFIKADITGGFDLTDRAIIFMENFTKDALLKWIKFGTQFIP